ncbi:MAG: hypothetical protein NC124_20715 [Clostridium sp.]|nr:hypothetical protein [Clostridium sp.]
MYIKKLIQFIQKRPLMYLQEEKIDYIYHFLLGHCGFACRCDFASEMDKEFELWFGKWLYEWMVEHYDKNYKFKTFHWNDTLKEITGSEEEAVQLFYTLCETFFSDYEEETGYFEWKKDIQAAEDEPSDIRTGERKNLTGCYKAVMSAIEKYYPKGIAFEEEQYQESVEHTKFKHLLENTKMRSEKDRFFQEAIQSVFGEYHVQRHTYTYPYPSLHYSVLLKKNQDILDDDIELMTILGGKRYDLEIFISLLFPCCYFYTNETIYMPENNLPQEQWGFATHSANYRLDDQEVIALWDMFEKNDICVLPHEIVHMRVPDICTELLPDGRSHVEIFHCLFSDMVTDYF